MLSDSFSHGDFENCLDAAVGYTRRGFYVILLNGVLEDSRRCTCWRGPNCKDPGKHPVRSEWKGVTNDTRW